MMKKLLLIFMLIFVSVSSYSLIESVYSENMAPGKTGEVVIVFYNHERYKEDSIQMTAYMPDTGDFYRKGGFYVKGKSPASQRMFFEVEEDLTPGYYPVIITLENDNGLKEKSHSWVYVG